jgi:hypothetical protein
MVRVKRHVNTGLKPLTSLTMEPLHEDIVSAHQAWSGPGKVDFSLMGLC